MRRSTILCAALGLVVISCGGGSSRSRAIAHPEGAPFHVPTILRTFADQFAPGLGTPDGDVDALELRRRDVRGEGRTEIMLALVRAHLLASETEATPRKARWHLRRAVNLASRATQRVRDQPLGADSRVLQSWGLVALERYAQAQRTLEFVTRAYRDSGEQAVVVAWILLGEAYFAEENWDDAADAYRFLLGMLDHPLYPLALYRTAHCLDAEGRGEEAMQMLRDVERLGCVANAPRAVTLVADRASLELGTSASARAELCATNVQDRGLSEAPPAFQ